MAKKDEIIIEDEDADQVTDLEDTSEDDELDRGDFIPDEDEAAAEDEEDEEDESEEEEDAEEDDGSGSEEADEEDDEDVGDDEEDDEYEDDDDPRIPLSRLNQVIGQREEAAQRAEWLESQLEKLLDKQLGDNEEKEQKPAYDFATSESKYVDLILEGETGKAAALRAEIDGARQGEIKELIRQTQEAAKETSTTASKAALEESRFETLRENYENKFTFLDADSDQYNEEAVDTINTLMTGYLAAGEAKSVALKKAVQKAAPMYKVKPVKSEKSKDRVTKQRKKNVKTVKQQPPKLRGKGTREKDTESVNIGKLSDKQYNSLTKREKAILRGDIVG